MIHLEKQLWEALAESENRLRALYSSSRDQLVVLGLDQARKLQDEVREGREASEA